MKRSETKYNVGVVIGRFQVHELHPGHVELLNWVNDNHDTMIVFLGNSPVLSRSNPLPYNARRMMIQEQYPDALVLPLDDMRDDRLWSDQVDDMISRVVRPTETVCIYGSRDSFIPHYTGKNQTQAMEGTGHFWSGSEVREKIANKTGKNADFRAGAIYAANGAYPRVIPTVDAAVFTKDGDIVMVRKNGEDKLRFPGGYVEPGSTFASTIKREIREEVGDLEVNVSYIGDLEIDDWRYRGNQDIIHTTVFRADILWGGIGRFTDVAEIAETDIVTQTNLRLGYRESVVPEHHAIVEMLIMEGMLDNEPA